MSYNQGYAIPLALQAESHGPHAWRDIRCFLSFQKTRQRHSRKGKTTHTARVHIHLTEEVQKELRSEE